MIIINSRLSIPDDQIEFNYACSGGPGGQNVNKVSSKVYLTWRPAESGLLPEQAIIRLKNLYPRFWTNAGELKISSQLTRDQGKNRQDCIRKLIAVLQKALIVPKKRIPTKPTHGSVLRRLDNKARQAKKKQNRQQKSWD